MARDNWGSNYRGCNLRPDRSHSSPHSTQRRISQKNLCTSCWRARKGRRIKKRPQFAISLSIRRWREALRRRSGRPKRCLKEDPSATCFISASQRISLRRPSNLNPNLGLLTGHRWAQSLSELKREERKKPKNSHSTLDWPRVLKTVRGWRVLPSAPCG